jgi:menaquinone-dependent protoporphyrinogen oxidase
VKKFINENLDNLLKMPVSLYICSLGDDKENEKYLHVFPKNLLSHASPVSFFGGMVIFKRLNFFARLIMRMITKSKKDIHQLKHHVINQFVKEIADS